LREILEVIEPGAFTTIQDLGRIGFRKLGVPLSGGLDSFSLRVANWLVGNHENCACIETTFLGPRLVVLSESLIALAGADVPVLLNGCEQDVWSSFLVRPGDTLIFKPVTRGLRSYIAVSGGIDCPVAMGSRSTYLAGGIGGMSGKALRTGDTICAKHPDLLSHPRSVHQEFIPKIGSPVSVRGILGPQEDHFDKEGFRTFFDSSFQVTVDSNRMGYRLEGPRIDFRAGMASGILSEPCLPGNVQIPPDGQPIILLNEQTVGGYAKIATIINCDLDLIAQTRPGDKIKFERISLETAHHLSRLEKRRLEKLRRTLLD
jgi:antagonist of KipI